MSASVSGGTGSNATGMTSGRTTPVRASLRALLGVVGVGEAGEDLLADPVTFERAIVEPLRRGRAETRQAAPRPDRDDADVGQSPDHREESSSSSA